MKSAFSALILMLAALAHADAQRGTSAPFVYQGDLSQGGIPVTGSFDFQFELFSVASGGTGMGVELVDAVSVSDGVFTVTLDFVNDFAANSQLFLEISVRETGGGSYVLLNPRQRISPAPLSHAALSVATDAVDSNSIDDGSIAAADVNSSLVQLRVDQSCPSGNAIRVINENGNVTCESVSGAGNAWALTGNVGTSPGVSFLGTVDDAALDFRVDNSRVMRYESGTVAFDSPNIIGGHGANTISGATDGAVIAGGGTTGAPNTISERFAFIGAGLGNDISGNHGVIAGGLGNTVTAEGGGILGGSQNTVSGLNSVALGQAASAAHNNSFVFADNNSTTTTAPQQFLIQARGGVGIGTAAPEAQLHVNESSVADPLRVDIQGTRALVVNRSNGGVTIGPILALPPEDGLQVLGTITALGNVTRWESIAAGEFQELESTSSWRNDAGYVSGGSFPGSTGPEFAAAVNLPHGAVITELRARVLDNDGTGDINIRLKRYNLDGVDNLVAEDGTNGSSATIQTLLSTTITNGTVDNEDYAYVVELDIPNGSTTSSIRVYGVRITYTIASVYH